MGYEKILIISDTHCPFDHQDAIPFLKAVKKSMDFKDGKDLCVHIGDEISAGAWSYHEKDQSMPGPDDEMDLAIGRLKEYYRLFPDVTVLESNHGSLAYRKAKSGNIPSQWIKSYRDALQAPASWTWTKHLRVSLASGEPVNFFHGLRTNAFAEALVLGESLVQGHHHNALYIRKEWVPAIKQVLFGMQVGCLINDKSPEFDYNKNTAKRPALGCGIIYRGSPRVMPLRLNYQGRWLGRL